MNTPVFSASAASRGAVPLRALCHLVHVLVHGALVLGRGDLSYQLVLGSQDHVGATKEGVGPGREDGDALACAVDGERNLGTHRLANPVELLLLDALWPIDVGQAVEQTIGVLGDAQHPLLHHALFDRISCFDVDPVP